MSGQNQGRVLSQESDKRYFPRWKVNSRVVYHVPGEYGPCAGITKDLSCAGACIIGDRHLKPQQRISVTVHLTHVTKIKLSGNIQWARGDGARLIMGVTFYDTPDYIQELILQHAFEIDKEKVVNQWFKGWEEV